MNNHPTIIQSVSIIKLDLEPLRKHVMNNPSPGTRTPDLTLVTNKYYANGIYNMRYNGWQLMDCSITNITCDSAARKYEYAIFQGYKAQQVEDSIF